ncbi:MAG: hypothetical protein H0V30_00300 [Chitinophagaceae bacterium]|nr:hypothetical protein [Chitinophagaceae bacterium]
MKRFLKFAVISMGCILLYFPVSALSDMNAISPEFLSVNTSKTHSFTLNQIIELTPRKYKLVTGKKMSLAQKISLKYLQHSINRKLKNGQPVDLQQVNQDIDATDFNFVGFLMGLFFSIFGVLIAYLIGERSKIKWSWVGFGFGAVILLLILIR